MHLLFCFLTYLLMDPISNSYFLSETCTCGGVKIHPRLLDTSLFILWIPFLLLRTVGCANDLFLWVVCGQKWSFLKLYLLKVFLFCPWSFRNLTLEERSYKNSWQLDCAFCSMGRSMWTGTELSGQQSCQWAILELIVTQSKPLSVWCYSWHIDYKFTNRSSPKAPAKLLTNP